MKKVVIKKVRQFFIKIDLGEARRDKISERMIGFRRVDYNIRMLEGDKFFSSKLFNNFKLMIFKYIIYYIKYIIYNEIISPTGILKQARQASFMRGICPSSIFFRRFWKKLAAHVAEEICWVFVTTRSHYSNFVTRHVSEKVKRMNQFNSIWT